MQTEATSITQVQMKDDDCRKQIKSEKCRLHEGRECCNYSEWGRFFGLSWREEKAKASLDDGGGGRCWKMILLTADSDLIHTWSLLGSKSSLCVKLDANLLANFIQTCNRMPHHLISVRSREAESGTNADQTSDGKGSTRTGNSLWQ